MSPLERRIPSWRSPVAGRPGGRPAGDGEGSVPEAAPGDGTDGAGAEPDETGEHGVEGTPADHEHGVDREHGVEEGAGEPEVAGPAPKGGRTPRLGPFRRMYRGLTTFDFVGRRRWWFALSGTIILAGIISLGFRGLNFGIDFRGGTSWTVVAAGVTQPQATSAVEATGVSQPVVEILGGKTVQVQADLNSLPTKEQQAQSEKVSAALAKLAHTSTRKVSITSVGPNWGSQVTQRALIALIVFLAAVSIYISLRFEPKMALAAFVALLHDLLVTSGVYSLAGFQVTPDTVIAILTILGYSLYDTVVVFDRVRDNAKGLGSTGRITYSDMINLSMNQTLARSVNTSLVAVLPVLAVLVVGAEILGATSLQDYGLALFIGLMSGAYSSIFIASPVLAMLKEREPRYIAIRQRVEARGERALLSPAAAMQLATVSGPGPSQPGRRRPATGGTGGGTGVLRPGAARQRSVPGVGGAAAASAPGAPGDIPPTPAGGAAKPVAQHPRPGSPRGPQPRRGGKGGKGKRRR